MDPTVLHGAAQAAKVLTILLCLGPKMSKIVLFEEFGIVYWIVWACF